MNISALHPYVSLGRRPRADRKLLQGLRLLFGLEIDSGEDFRETFTRRDELHHRLAALWKAPSIIPPHRGVRAQSRSEEARALCQSPFNHALTIIQKRFITKAARRPGHALSRVEGESVSPYLTKS